MGMKDFGTGISNSLHRNFKGNSAIGGIFYFIFVEIFGHLTNLVSSLYIRLQGGLCVHNFRLSTFLK